MLSDGVIFDKMLHVNMWLWWKGNKCACKYGLINLFHPKPPVAINLAGRSQDKKKHFSQTRSSSLQPYWLKGIYTLYVVNVMYQNSSPALAVAVQHKYESYSQ